MFRNIILGMSIAILAVAASHRRAYASACPTYQVCMPLCPGDVYSYCHTQNSSCPVDQNNSGCSYVGQNCPAGGSGGYLVTCTYAAPY